MASAKNFAKNHKPQKHLRIFQKKLTIVENTYFSLPYLEGTFYWIHLKTSSPLRWRRVHLFIRGSES